MAQQKLTLSIEVDKKTGNIKVVQGEIAGLGTAVKGAGDKARAGSKGFGALADSLGPLIAAGSVLKFFKDATGAAIVQQDAVAKLNAALLAQGILTNETSNDLQNYASELQKVTRFGDETILNTQAMLTTFGLQGEELKSATQATLDMSTALKVDLKAAAILVGKAFVGETSSLSRYGIILDESIPKTEKFAAVIEKLNTNFGGAAAADAKTFGGEVQQLKNTFGDVTEQIGFQLIPTLKGMNETFASALPFLFRFGTAITGIVRTVITSFDFVANSVSILFDSIASIVSVGVLNIKSILSGNMDEALIRVNELRGEIGKNLNKLVDGARETSGDLGTIAQETFDGINGAQKKALDISEEQLAKSLEIKAVKREEAEAKELERLAVAAEDRAARMFEVETFELEATAEKEVIEFDRFMQGINARAAALSKATDDKVQLQIIEDSRLAIIEKKKEANKIKKDAKKKADKKKIDDFLIKGSKDLFANLASVAKSGGEEAAGISRAFDVASATRSAFTAAAKTLKDGGPYPLNVANAALVLGLGLNNAKQIAGFEHGGITPGGRVLVGEGGPELADLPIGTRITPAGETRRLLNDSGGGGGGGGMVINLTIENNITVSGNDEVATQVIESIQNGVDEFRPDLEQFGRSVRDLINRQGNRSS